MSACTDWPSYAEINRPNCLILGRFAEKQGANRFGRLILATRKLARNASRKSEGALNLFSLGPKHRRQFINSNKLLGNSQTLQCLNLFSYCFSGKVIRGRD